MISEAGGRDPVDAHDPIAQTRLEHQAAQVRRGGRPDEFVAPGALFSLERSHLHDALVVVRPMQPAATQGRSVL